MIFFAKDSSVSYLMTQFIVSFAGPLVVRQLVGMLYALVFLESTISANLLSTEYNQLIRTVNNHSPFPFLRCVEREKERPLA